MLLILPIILPLLTAAVLLLSPRPLQRRLVVAGSALHLGIGAALFVAVHDAGVIAVQMGNWPAPFGITLVADRFSATMVLTAAFMGLAVIVYSLSSIDYERERYGYFPLVQILLMGVCGAFLTGDLFNLYVWFEVLLMASFVLLALGGERRQLEGALKYVTLNLLSSALFLAAVGLLYGNAGTLNMADLAQQLASRGDAGMNTAIAMLFFIAFGIKAAAFPLFGWLPASYHTPPIAVTALFSALLTKVGVYALVRVFTLLFTTDVAFTHNLILVVAGLTMVTGVLGAVAQNEIRRLLSFHIVSQIGYLLMGLGLYTVAGLTGTIFFMVHVIVAKSALFLVAGLVERRCGTSRLPQLGGLYAADPRLAAIFFLAAMGLAGIPPLSGFVAKLQLVRAGLDTEQYAIVATALGVSVLTLFSMTKIWSEAFWKPAPRDHPEVPALPVAPPAMLIPAAALAGATLLLGLGAEMLLHVATRAAEQLMDPSQYIRTVLGG